MGRGAENTVGDESREPELCSYFSTGTERAQAYFTNFLITGDLGLVGHTEKKEDGDAPLTAINPSSADVGTK
jgi:hypothetical protein